MNLLARHTEVCVWHEKGRVERHGEFAIGLEVHALSIMLCVMGKGGVGCGSKCIFRCGA